MRKDPKEFRERFLRWKAGELVYKDGLPAYEDGKEDEFDTFLKTLPDNQSAPGAYNTRRYWELNGKPNDFAEAIGIGMYNVQKDNGILGWHANSVSYNDKNDTYEFMKPNYHPTRWMELVYGYDKNQAFQKDWKVQYNGPMLSDRYVRREKPGFKIKGGLLPKFEDGKSSYDDSTDFISKYEGWSDTAYLKKGDVPTIGYGTTNKKWVSKGRITRAQGRQAMMEDLAANEPMLQKNIRNYDRLPDTAKTVLRDILYNVGHGNMFNKSPKFMKALNAGDWEEAARLMDWDNNKPGFSGARKRNAARLQLFLQDLRNNPVLPQSEFVQQLYQRPMWLPKLDYIGAPTQYPLHNTVPQSISSWSGPDSPSVLNDIKLPSIYELINSVLKEYDLIIPPMFK